MRKNIFLIAVGILIGILVANMINYKEDKSWMPVLEQSGFDYLNDSMDILIKDLKEAEDEFRQGQSDELNKSLHHTMKDLLKLKMYYIPMTQIRQNVYDADRLYLIGKFEEAKNRLEKSAELLLQIGKLESKTLKNAANELRILLNELAVGIETGAENIKSKFKTAGEKANLMLLKGGLLITDIKFKEAEE